MEDRTLIGFVLGSLMVAEERITTKFAGLVAAAASEEEAAFLASQQVDEARHMQVPGKARAEKLTPKQRSSAARRAANAARRDEG